MKSAQERTNFHLLPAAGKITDTHQVQPLFHREPRKNGQITSTRNYSNHSSVRVFQLSDTSCAFILWRWRRVTHNPDIRIAAAAPQHRQTAAGVRSFHFLALLVGRALRDSSSKITHDTRSKENSTTTTTTRHSPPLRTIVGQFCALRCSGDCAQVLILAPILFHIFTKSQSHVAA